MAVKDWFAKTLSENDLGLTGGHQAGPLIPKPFVGSFPTLNEDERNPRAPIRLFISGRVFKEANIIYYNNRRVGGTRDEYRITPFAANDYRDLGARVGDFLVFRRINSSDYEIEIISPTSDRAKDLGLTGRPVPGGAVALSRDATKDYEEAEKKVVELDFRVPDSWGAAKQRRCQDVFRTIVMQNFAGECCMPGCPVDDSRFLEATHIKGWAAGVDSRLDPGNGLLLCKHHHAFLDLGLLSLRRNARAELIVEVSTRVGHSVFLKAELTRLSGKRIKPHRKFAIKDAYLDFHWSHVFLR